MNRILSWFLLQTICTFASAVGLGEMKVYSSLDEPLRAEIPIFDIQDLSLENIKVSLAQPDEYDKRGLERIEALELIQISIQKNNSGLPIIFLNSKERISEPFMDFLIDVSWPSGEIYRDYTILLDPPDYKEKFKQNITFTPEAPEARTPVLEGQADLATANSYGPTKNNESIWQIAQRYNNNEVSLQQLILAIVGTNSAKFAEGNLNGLYPGSYLKIPDITEVKKVSDSLAKLEVLAHDKAWQEKTPIEHALLPPYIGTTAPNKENSSLKTGNIVPAHTSYIAPLKEDPKNKMFSWWPLESILKADSKNVVLQTNNKIAEPSSADVMVDKPVSIDNDKTIENLKLLNTKLQEKIRALNSKNQALDKELQLQLVKLKNITTKLHHLMEKVYTEKTEDKLFTWYELGFWIVLFAFILILLLNLSWLIARYKNTHKPVENLIEPVNDLPRIEDPITETQVIAENFIEKPEAPQEDKSIEPEVIKESEIEFPPEPEEELKPEESVLEFTIEEESLAPVNPENPIDTKELVDPLEDDSHVLEFEIINDKDTQEEVLDVDNSISAENTELKSKEALETLLELANTYISMNDIEAAKQALEEVVEFGSKAQKAKAKKLLKSLG